MTDPMPRDHSDNMLDPEALTRRRRWNQGKTLEDGTRLLWYREMLIAITVYLGYETIRNRSKANPERAFRNAERLISWQQSLHINHEKAIQDWVIDLIPIVIASNYFYGIAYIVVTIGTLVWLFQKRPEHYRRWRTTLAFGTLLGLVGFATFPLMPPRLLDLLGDGEQVYGFVDTLVKYPTFWSFESPTMKSISNQFAAMPSLHCGWAFWSFAAVFPLARTRWAKVLIALYPIVTVSVVVLTGNHYFLDAVGGLVIFVVGYGLARALEAVQAWWRRTGSKPSGGDDAPALTAP